MPYSLSEPVVDALLEKLATSDSFRETFSKDPRAALAEVGHAAAADESIQDGAWACLAVSRLAPKEAIRASRDALRRQLVTAKAGYNPISLETPKA